jgi:hypothetical protein
MAHGGRLRWWRLELKGTIGQWPTWLNVVANKERLENDKRGELCGSKLHPDFESVVHPGHAGRDRVCGLRLFYPKSKVNHFTSGRCLFFREFVVILVK